jgi:hypothetical protein
MGVELKDALERPIQWLQKLKDLAGESHWVSTKYSVLVIGIAVLWFWIGFNARGVRFRRSWTKAPERINVYMLTTYSGSPAARFQTLYGGSVPKGSWFSRLQSFGATRSGLIKMVAVAVPLAAILITVRSRR